MFLPLQGENGHVDRLQELWYEFRTTSEMSERWWLHEDFAGHSSKSGNGCSINLVQIPCMKDGLGSIRTAQYKGEWLSPVLIILKLTVTL